MKNVMKAAHKLVKEIKAEYPNVDYKAQLGICISYLSNGNNEIALTDVVYAAAEKATEELGADDFKWNTWEKNGLKRIYISLVWYSKGRTAKETKCGYIDVIADEYVAIDKYSKIYNVISKEKR